MKVNYFRYPRTKNEMTQFYASVYNEESVFVKVRGRRRPKTLPCAWCDLDKSNMRNRNWKLYRRTQWKNKK